VRRYNLRNTLRYVGILPDSPERTQVVFTYKFYKHNRTLPVSYILYKCKHTYDNDTLMYSCSTILYVR